MILPDEKHYAVALSVISSPKSNNLWDYMNLFPPSEIYNRIFQRREPLTQSFIVQKYPEKPSEAAKRIIDKTRSKSIRIIDYWDPDYPPLLKEISRPPVVLYVKGTILNTKAVAIVGTRKADKKSRIIANRISSDLSISGYTIVSGMAMGIDREAHMGALDSGGNTIGVLANGIDIMYPSSNRDLYKLIESSTGSALISEYPPEIFAGKWTFVRRNRIISGLSLGTVVVQASHKSGALITAKYAIEQNREVFVCPGHSFSDDYKGCHELIQSGAVLVSDSSDIKNELPESSKIISSEIPFNIIREKEYTIEKNNIEQVHISSDIKDPTESKILEYLSSGESNIDSIIRDLQYPTNEIHSAISMLEFTGKVCRNGNLVSKI